jgi:AraC family transcriptional activator of pobA
LAQRTVIPSFFLFGEPLKTVEGKFLHLEDLDDRSRPNDWNIRAHAHADLNQTIPFAGPCLLLVPAGAVHGFVYEADSSGAVLTIADSYLRDLTEREQSFAGLFRAPCQLPLSEDSRIAGALASLSRELVWTAPGHAAAVEAHLLTVPAWASPSPVCATLA